MTQHQKELGRIRQARYNAKKYAAAPMVSCACGCGKELKAVNKHGKPRQFINGHSRRKYSDPFQYKREYLKRHKNELVEKRLRMRRERRVLLIQYKGSKCEGKDCTVSYNGKNAAVFHFHHCRGAKRFGISAALCDWSMQSLKLEVDKCQLLCANCHALAHSDEY